MTARRPFRDVKRERNQNDRDAELAEVADEHGDEIARLAARFIEAPAERRPNGGKMSRLNDGKVDANGVPLSRRYGAGAIRKGAKRG